MGTALALLLSMQQHFASSAFLLALMLQATGAPPPATGPDPAVVAAWITAGSAVVVVLVGGGIAFLQLRYQIRKNVQLERRLQEALQAKSFQHDEDMAHLEKKLDQQGKQQEQEEKRKEQEDERTKRVAQLHQIDVWTNGSSRTAQKVQ